MLPKIWFNTASCLVANNDRLSSSAGNFRSCRVPLPLALAVSSALAGVGREGSAPHWRVFFGWWPHNEAHFLRYALRAARTLHPHQRAVGHRALQTSHASWSPCFSTLVRRNGHTHSVPIPDDSMAPGFPSSTTNPHIDVGQTASVEHPKLQCLNEGESGSSTSSCTLGVVFSARKSFSICRTNWSP